MSPAEPERSDSEPPAPLKPPSYDKSGGRPDWLVGAEEGVTAEHDRVVSPDPTRPVLKMVRGTAGDPHDGQDLPVTELELGGPTPGEGGAPSTRLKLHRPTDPAGGPEAGKPSAPKKAWTAAASSIPSLRREAPPAARPPAIDPREFDEPAERETKRGLPDDHPNAPPPPVALPPLQEAWWIVALEELRNNRRLQIGLAALAVALLAFTYWPRRQPTVSIADLQRHAKEYDGRAVTVRGRVGDVFPAGGGYTFYLQQGGATIVVFTRSRVPVPNEMVSVKGTISTGFLDGSPHQSLFEDK